MTIISRMAILEIYKKGHKLVLSPIDRTITIDENLTYSVSHETVLALVILLPMDTARFTVLQKPTICDKIEGMRDQDSEKFVTVRIVKDGVESFQKIRTKPESYYHSRTFNKAKRQSKK